MPFTKHWRISNPAEGFRRLGYIYDDDATFKPHARDFEYTFDLDVVPLAAWLCLQCKTGAIRARYIGNTLP